MLKKIKILYNFKLGGGGCIRHQFKTNKTEHYFQDAISIHFWFP